MIRAVISDFGGVLTSPLSGSFQAFADRSGITLAMMGEAFGTLQWRDGVHPLHELECGRLSEEAFVPGLQRALSSAAGHEVALFGFHELLGRRAARRAGRGVPARRRPGGQLRGALATGMAAVRYRDVEQAVGEIRAVLAGGACS